MHKSLSGIQPLLLLFVAAAFAACGDVGDAPIARTGSAIAVSQSSGETLAIDTSQSAIRWRAAKVTRAHDGGFSSFRGTASLDPSGDVSGLQIEIDARSIWSDTDRLTSHLKDDDFFDVDTYPVASFVSDDLAPVDSSSFTHLVTGNLTMHGQTRSISFPATISTTAGGVQARGDFIIDRRQWGIAYAGKPDDIIEDEVRILFDVVAGRAIDAPAPSPASSVR